jgi:hypothetical protein
MCALSYAGSSVVSWSGLLCQRRLRSRLPASGALTVSLLRHGVRSSLTALPLHHHLRVLPDISAGFDSWTSSLGLVCDRACWGGNIDILEAANRLTQ